jgi:hypothetical protein
VYFPDFSKSDQLINLSLIDIAAFGGLDRALVTAELAGYRS